MSKPTAVASRLALLLLLLVAGCSAPPGTGAPYFAQVGPAAMIPGLPISLYEPTTTDIWGHTVPAPGMDLRHGGSTTQSLGIDPPGTGSGNRCC